MTIKYEMKFENAAFTLTQTINQAETVAIPEEGVPVAQNRIPNTFPKSANIAKGSLGGSGFDDPAIGTGSPDGGGPLTIIGPFIFMCPCAKPKPGDGHE